MKIFQYIFTFVVIFLFFNQSDAFGNFTEGTEYKFKYNHHVETSVKRGVDITEDHYEFQTVLVIKALLDNWLECELSDISGSNGIYSYWVRYDKIMVKLNEGKVVKINSTKNYIENEEGVHSKNEVIEMIEQIVKDNNYIVNVGNELNREIEMPLRGKCGAKLTKESEENKIIFKATTTDPKCVVDDDVLSEFGNPSSNSFSTVTLVYDSETDKQIELRLNNEVKIFNSFFNSYTSNQITTIEYLGSSDYENFVNFDTDEWDY